MSDLQPKGIPIEIGGVERHLLFTIAVIDELQSKYDATISQVIEMLQDERKLYDVMTGILLAMVNDEIDRNRFFRHEDEENITEKELKWLITYEDAPACIGAIFKAYGISLPEVDDGDEDPNAESRSG